MGDTYERLDPTSVSKSEAGKVLDGFRKKVEKKGVLKSLVMSAGLGFLKIGRYLRDSVSK